jgi:hypothetical protein
MQENKSPPVQVWDGTFPPAQSWRSKLKEQGIAANFSGGSGSSTNPWQISTPQELAQIASDVAAGNSHLGDYFILMNDIYLNLNSIDPSLVDPATPGPSNYDGGNTPVNEWTPIGGAGHGYVDSEGEHAYGFDGSFDGNNKTICNAFYNRQDPDVGKGLHPENQVGIFGDIYSGASIKNLKTAGGYIGGNISVGGIVGRTWGGNITNCHNGNFVYGIGSQGAGGVAATSWVYIPEPNSGGAISTPVIDKCYNSATIISNYVKSGNVGSGSGGGIVGENEGTVINSWNTGVVSCKKNAGGLIGSNQNSSGGEPPIYVDPAYINNCYNTGNVGSFAGDGSIPAVSAKIAGGIMGYQTGSCQNVYNIGTITAPATGGVAGQIIGEMNADSNETNDYFNRFTGSSPAVFVGSSPTFVPPHFSQFANASTPKGNLLTSLNNWVSSHPSLGYSNWTRDTSDVINNGFPTLS